MPRKHKILLIEDDVHIRALLTSVVVDEGYDITAVETAAEGIAETQKNLPDLILLDLNLPDGNGLEIITPIRTYTDAPIIVVSGAASPPNKVHGLDMGADDFVAKPIDMNELLARIRAHIRRYHTEGRKAPTTTTAHPETPKRYAFAHFILDRNQLQAFHANGTSTSLTVREFRMLEAMVLRAQQVLTREQILNSVQCDNLDITDRAVDVQMLRIRRKLHDLPGRGQLIKAVRGVGYILDCNVNSLPPPDPHAA